MRVLIIEDDPTIHRLLKEVLLGAGYHVTSAYTGVEGKLYADAEAFDAVLLDLMLPGMPGEEVIKHIRQKSTMPILVLSAKVDKETKLYMLDNGADDFIEKPFDTDELLARIQANLRRARAFPSTPSEESLLSHGHLVLDRTSMSVAVKGQPLSLTPIEYGILELLLSHPHKVFSKENIYQSVWQDAYMGDENTVNVHISNIRSKIAKIDDETEYIKTVWGMGFRLAKSMLLAS